MERDEEKEQPNEALASERNVNEENLESQKSNDKSLKNVNTKMKDQKILVDVLSKNCNPAKGLAMRYIAPTIIDGRMEIEVDDEDADREIHYWMNSLIMYVLGEDLSMNTVKNYMMKTWNYVQLPDIFFHDEGYFIPHFNSGEDMDAILMKGPYTYRGMPMILKEWKAGYNLKKDMMRMIPIWIKFPMLPLHLWGDQI